MKIVYDVSGHTPLKSKPKIFAENSFLYFLLLTILVVFSEDPMIPKAYI